MLNSQPVYTTVNPFCMLVITRWRGGSARHTADAIGYAARTKSELLFLPHRTLIGSLYGLDSASEIESNHLL